MARQIKVPPVLADALLKAMVPDLPLDHIADAMSLSEGSVQQALRPDCSRVYWLTAPRLDAVIKRFRADIKNVPSFAAVRKQYNQTLAGAAHVLGVSDTTVFFWEQREAAGGSVPVCVKYLLPLALRLAIGDSVDVSLVAPCREHSVKLRKFLTTKSISHADFQRGAAMSADRFKSCIDGFNEVQRGEYILAQLVLGLHPTLEIRQRLQPVTDGL